MIKKIKVLAYITNKDKLLVFNEPDYPNAGIQVAGGTVEKNESLDEAVLREIKEETGLTNFSIVKYLGQVEKDMSEYGKNEIHLRHFYHIITEERPNETWQHIEKFCSEGNKEEILFNFYWLKFDDAKKVLLSHGDLIHLI